MPSIAETPPYVNELAFIMKEYISKQLWARSSNEAIKKRIPRIIEGDDVEILSGGLRRPLSA